MTDLSDSTKKVLHIGCGEIIEGKLHTHFKSVEWREVRLDIDPAVKPDIVADIRDMHEVESSSYDAVWSSHNLEHLYAHEVPLAIREMSRVLKPDGFALVTLPDLQAVARLVAEDRLDDIAYQSAAGPVTPLDIIYGFGPSLLRGNQFMAHRTGFTKKPWLMCWPITGSTRFKSLLMKFLLYGQWRTKAKTINLWPSIYEPAFLCVRFGFQSL